MGELLWHAMPSNGCASAMDLELGRSCMVGNLLGASKTMGICRCLRTGVGQAAAVHTRMAAQVGILHRLLGGWLHGRDAQIRSQLLEVGREPQPHD